MPLTLPERLGIAFLVLFAAGLIMGVPVVGMANSGDFERLLMWGGLGYAGQDFEAKYFHWVVPTFAYRWPPPMGVGYYFSSEAPFVKVAAILGWLADPRAFDLRWMGVVHLTAYAGALWLLFRGWRAATGCSGLWLVPPLAVVFGDVGYVAYFHSFYSEAAAIIFLLATTGAGLLLASGPPTEARVRIFFVALGLFMTAKTQNLTLALPILAFAALVWWRARGLAWRPLVPRLAAGIFALAAIQYLINPPNMTEANKFASVFNGILKDSPTPAQDLADLGLPQGFAALAGHDIFRADRPPFDIHGEAFRARFFGTHSHRKVLGFYLTHPARFYGKLSVSAAHAYTLRPGYLGNFAREAGLPRHAKAETWSGWSRFKEERMPHTLPFTLGLGLAAVAAIALAWWRDRGVLRRGPAEWLLVLAAMATIAFVTPIVGDGESDHAKHMFMFYALADLGMVLAAGLAASGLRMSVTGDAARTATAPAPARPPG